MSSDTQTLNSQNFSYTQAIDIFRSRWFSILAAYQRDLEEVDQVDRFAPMRLAIARDLLNELSTLPSTLETEIQRLRVDNQIINKVRTELLDIINRLEQATERIIGDAAEEMKLASVEDSKNRSGLNKGIKNKLGRRARNVAFITSLPILLPLLCICTCFVVFLAILTSLTGGGPDQTQNMQSAKTICTDAGSIDLAGCEAIKERIKLRMQNR